MDVEFEANNNTFKIIHPKTCSGKGIDLCLQKYLYGLKNYLNELKGNRPKELEGISDCKFRLFFHSALDLYLSNWQAEQGILKMSNSKDYGIPNIHLTTYNIFSNEEVLKQLVPKRYKKIIDSSIWNYYVPLDTERKDSQGETIWEYSDNYPRFTKVLKDIGLNTSAHLYDLSISHEYADLNARILQESSLKGSHNTISPFIFHSEYDMRVKMQDIILKKKDEKVMKVKDEVKKYKWRFLLLDDQSINRMSGINNHKVDICKLQIIYNNLHRLLKFKKEGIWFRTFDFQPVRESNDGRIIDKENHIIIRNSNNNKRFKSVEPIIQCERVEKIRWNAHKFEINNSVDSDYFKDPQIIIDCVNHVDEAEYCLQKYKYDIILIDYLLDKEGQEYGYFLLNNLQIWYSNYNIGPNNILTMMFISAFTTAMRERILELGLERTEMGLWHIGNSACPTNTPYLFSYLLLQLMKYRIKNLINDNEGEQLTIINLLEDIYVETNYLGMESVRKEANRYFKALLFMREKYRRLRRDLDKIEERDLREHSNDTEYIAKYVTNMNSSLLVYSAFKVVHHFSEVFFDHLQHLVYLTAFGTIRQWQDMWEEYEFIYKELYEYDKYVVEYDEDKNVRKRGKIICNAIKEYIINLKENSI